MKFRTTYGRYNFIRIVLHQVETSNSLVVISSRLLSHAAYVQFHAHNLSTTMSMIDVRKIVDSAVLWFNNKTGCRLELIYEYDSVSFVLHS